MFQLKWSNDAVFYVYDTELQQSGIGVSVDWSLTYDGGTLDITSWELEFVIRPFAGSDTVAVLPNADITTDSSGNITFTTDAGFTTGLTPQTYIFELRRIDAGHEKIIRFGNWALYATPLVAPVANTGGIVPINLGGTGEDLSLEGPSVIVQLTTGANLTALTADLSSTTLYLRKDLTWDVPGGVGTGTVTSVSVVTANGVSGSVATATSTPAITLTLGAITPTSVNSVVISGSSTPTLAVTGTTTVSGANTGDQNLFSAIAVSGQTTITANSATTTLTVVGSTNITVTTDNATKTITIAATGVGTGTVTSVSVVTANGVSGSVATATTTPAITLTLGAITPTSVNGNTITTGTGTLTLSTYTLTMTGTGSVQGTNTGDQTFVSGNAGTVTFIDAGGDTTTWLALARNQTGDQSPATDAQLTYNATTNALTTTTFIGALVGNASTATALFTPRSIYGNLFDGTADLTQVIASTFGGTGNGFTKISGPASAEKTFTLPNASAKILTDNAPVLVVEGGTGRATGTTAYSLVATGTTATGTQQTLANGATTEILVGGGSSALPVWTTAQGSGAPVRATAPTITGATLTTSSVNGVALSGSSSTLSVTGSASVSGANTGDQNIFSSIVVSGQTTVTANSTATALTIVGASNIVVTTDNTTKTITISASGLGTGSVTNVSVVTANGVSGSVANPTSTPAITLTLGAITPTSVNGNTITTGTGTLTLSTFTVTAAANATISGTNTGDQNLFSSVVVSGQTTVTANSATTALTLAAGANIAITTDNTTKTVTIAATSTGGTVTTVSVVTANGVSGSVANPTTTPAITLALGAITPTSVNTVVISGSSTPTLAVTGTTTVSGPNTGDQTFTATGDATAPGSTSNLALTLATVATAGTAGSSTAIPSVTIDVKGRVLTLGTNSIIAPAGNLSGTSLSTSVVTASITTFVDPITSGTWNATNIALGHGGTGATLSAPATDKIFFYDVSAGASDFLTVGAGLAISGTTLNVTAGGGDFFGPASSTTNAVVLFANTTGKLGQNSTLVIDPTTGVAVLGGSAATFKIGSTTAGILQWRDSTGATISLTAGSNSLTLSGTAQLSATNFIGSLTGNATSATTLQTSRNIYGNSFNGSADVTGIVGLQYGGTGSSLTDPNADRILFWDDSGNQVTWLTVGTGLLISGTTIVSTAGGGDFFGPSSSTDNAIVRFDGTTGKLGQNSTTTVDDTGILTTRAAVLVNTLASGVAALIIRDVTDSSNVATITNDGTASFNSIYSFGDMTSFGLKTWTSAGNALVLQAYDTDDSVYRTFGTLTAGTTPTFVLQNTNIGTPTAGVATNITGLPVTTGLASITSPTFLGRNTAGTGNVEILSIVQATSMLNVMAGDGGFGGTKGLVPAPASGDATKVLFGNGTWQSAATGTVTSVGITGNNGIGVTGTNPVTSSGTITLGLGNITPTTVTTTGAIQAGTTTNGVIKWWDAANGQTVSITAGAGNLTLQSSYSFSAVTFIGNLVGNASTATALQTARSIYGGSFNGTADLAGPVTVAFGGTGDTSFTPYALIAGGTTSTGALQSLATGTSSNLLRSNGSSSLPSWTTIQVQVANISGYAVNMILGSDGSPSVVWRTFASYIDAWKATVTGYNASVRQFLTHDASGNWEWKNKSSC